MGDFFSFRKMITPFIIKVFYVLGAIAILIIAFYFIAEEEEVAIGLAILFGGELLWRLWGEVVILFFSIHEAAVDSREYLKRLCAAQPPSVPPAYYTPAPMASAPSASVPMASAPAASAPMASAPVQPRCPSCGAGHDKEAAFCTECGTKLTPVS